MIEWTAVALVYGRALANIDTILADLGASKDEVAKVTTCYQGSASADALHENQK